MSLEDLNLNSSIVLDPRNNPFLNELPLFMEYSGLLHQLIKYGLKFDVEDFYIEPLSKVLNWTIRDMESIGIDFSTNYADAASYAFNYQGSQIKHNFSIIVKTIHTCKKQECFSRIEEALFWKLTEKIKLFLDSKSKYHPIVIKVKRSCLSFQDVTKEELNLGSYNFFLSRIEQEAQKSNAFNLKRITFFYTKKPVSMISI